MTLLMARGPDGRRPRVAEWRSGMERDPIRLLEADSVGRPVDEEHGPDELVARHRTPGAGVAGLGAVVAHHEVAVRRDRPGLAEMLAVLKSVLLGEIGLFELHEFRAR